MSNKKKEGIRMSVCLTLKSSKQLDELAAALQISRTAVLAQAIARFHHQEPLVANAKLNGDGRRRSRKADAVDQHHIHR